MVAGSRFTLLCVKISAFRFQTNRQRAETDVDWEGLMNQLYALADESLGNRAKKVKEMLASTEPHLDALDRTIDRVSQTSIMFVDPARLANLADQMRQVVEAER